MSSERLGGLVNHAPFRREGGVGRAARARIGRGASAWPRSGWNGTGVRGGRPDRVAAGEARPWTEAETAGRLSVLARSVLGRGEQEKPPDEVGANVSIQGAGKGRREGPGRQVTGRRSVG